MRSTFVGNSAPPDDIVQLWAPGSKKFSSTFELKYFFSVPFIGEAPADIQRSGGSQNGTGQEEQSGEGSSI